MSKIMIVDNDITVQMDLEEYFEQSHHHLVGIVETEEEAILVAKETKPEIILVEIDLPGKADGIHIARNIRREMDVGIVFMTVCSNIDVVNRAKQVSPLAYVLKPFDEREIRAAIEIALHNQTNARKLKAANRALERRIEKQQFELATLKDKNNGCPMMTKVEMPVLNDARVSPIGLTTWRFMP